jgi:hypothetical protein
MAKRCRLNICDRLVNSDTMGPSHFGDDSGMTASSVR